MCSRPISRILNESVLYLGKSIGQAKYKRDESNVSTCPVILDSYTHSIRNLLFTLLMILNGQFIKPSNITAYIERFAILEILHGDYMGVL